MRQTGLTLLTAKDNSDSSLADLLDLSKQQRNLVLMRPLFQLELNKHSVGSEATGTGQLLKDVDTFYLALTALDFMMEGTTIHAGCTQQELIERLARVASTMKPSLAPTNSRKVAELIIDTLSNRANACREFSFEFFDGASRTVKRVNFRLVSYLPDMEDVYRYRPTAEGYLVYLGMLDMAPEDAQELMNKMLDLMIKRGRFASALEFAKRARTLSIEHRQFIRDRLAQAYRAPGSVNWKRDFEGKLRDARLHVTSRQSEDQRMLEAVHGALIDAEDPPVRQDLSRLHETLKSASEIRANLVTDISRAPDTYRDAQKSVFRARRPSRLPDLESNILPNLLGLSGTDLAENADNLVSALYPTKWPRLYGLNNVFGMLLERRREPEERAEEEGEIEPFTPAPEQFPPALISEVKQWILQQFKREGSCTLDELMARAEEENFSVAKLRCLVLTLFRSFPQSETQFPAMRATVEGQFKRSTAQGTNLRFSLLSEES